MYIGSHNESVHLRWLSGKQIKHFLALIKPLGCDSRVVISVFSKYYDTKQYNMSPISPPTSNRSFLMRLLEVCNDHLKKNLWEKEIHITLYKFFWTVIEHFVL